MSIKHLFDTDEEKAYWFSAMARLSDAVSATMIVSGNHFYALITIITGTIGREVAGYYQIKIDPNKKKNEGEQ